MAMLEIAFILIYAILPIKPSISDVPEIESVSEKMYCLQYIDPAILRFQ